MRYLEKFGLAAMAAMALMAFAASSASATAIYSGESKLGAGSIGDFSIPSGGSALLVDTENETLDTCTASTIQGKLTSASTGTMEELTWKNCTFPTTTITKGKLEVVWTGGTEGEAIVDAEIGVTINTVFFGSCIYGMTSGTKMGTITTFSSGAATLHSNAVAKKFSGSNVACPETSKFTGTYTTTEPTNLRVEKE